MMGMLCEAMLLQRLRCHTPAHSKVSVELLVVVVLVCWAHGRVKQHTYQQQLLYCKKAYPQVDV
jgi:hypothetical protein